MKSTKSSNNECKLPRKKKRNYSIKYLYYILHLEAHYPCTEAGEMPNIKFK